ncbi:DUF4169 family protein [Asticcacaulis benevestitus]|uniref:Uncharacterized protein n=1 Tax=Asticcacaulis benevestitus DSM 16100 = ATCC BAA-896 TaxID=1121022 RepID=V4RTP9_9CAUL|nr:DUF4169 family protein [Asticcacaulis benevestitus]ESQ94538.1 hypothetical protein ABENE_00155 [Asticcacaulis benevestitus DSM 16100 = ATCC BAA-896]
MAEMINLNKARKAMIKQREASKAAENRIIYGISTKVRNLEKTRQKTKADKLAQKRLKPDDDNKIS